MQYGLRHHEERGSDGEISYLFSRRQRKWLDKICLVLSVVLPITTLPQIYTTYTIQDASGVSLWMWVLYTIGMIPWLLYGIAYKSVPLIVSNALWITVQLIMVAGVLLYG
jgi:MtN3 and saliva related transmembrane protein